MIGGSGYLIYYILDQNLFEVSCLGVWYDWRVGISYILIYYVLDQNLSEVNCVGVQYDWRVGISYIIHHGPEFM